MANNELSQEILKRADAIGVWANGSIDKIGEGVGKISQVAYTQAIDIATQYIVFGRAYLTLLVVVGVILFIVAGYLIHLCIKESNRPSHHQKSYDNNYKDYVGPTHNENKWLFEFVGGMIVGMAGFALLAVNLKDMILCWAAPKVWIMIEITQLVKQYKGN